MRQLHHHKQVLALTHLSGGGPQTHTRAIGVVLESPGLRKILKVKILVVRILHPKRIWASNRPDGDKELGERDRCELIPGNLYPNLCWTVLFGC